MSAKNTGTWNAWIERKENTLLVVTGTFTTNGAQSEFQLSKNELQSIKPNDNLLNLSHAGGLDPNGTDTGSVHYKEILNHADEFETVTVLGDGTELAEIQIRK